MSTDTFDPAVLSVAQELQKLISEAYLRGREETAAGILKALENNGQRGKLEEMKLHLAQEKILSSEAKKRAPKGTSRALILRALKGGPLTPKQILLKAKTKDELVLSAAAIYFELLRGKKAKHYRNAAGKWSLL